MKSDKPEPWKFIPELWRLTMEPRRLKMEPWGFFGPLLQIRIIFYGEPDLLLKDRTRIKEGNSGPDPYRN
jgi:hypothetical protein